MNISWANVGSESTYLRGFGVSTISTLSTKWNNKEMEGEF